MTKLDEVMDTAVEELGRMATAQACVGEPVVAGAYTIIPIASVGFGGGLGRSPGGTPRTADGGTGGMGFGGGVRPVAVIIVGPEGVRIEPIPDLDKGDWTQVLQSLAERLTREKRK